MTRASMPNATRQARLKAGARNERTLEAVACTRLLGTVSHSPGPLSSGFLSGHDVVFGH